MIKRPWMFGGSAALVAAAAGALLYAPAAIAAIKAAFVELVLPSRPFNGSVSGGAGYQTTGPGSAGTLGVSSITLTNFGSASAQIFVFSPVFQGGFACGSSQVIGGSSPRFYVLVGGGQTLHLTYPSPLVMTPVSGQSCIAFSAPSGLDITVNGFVN
jgi:hypothetical protein